MKKLKVPEIARNPVVLVVWTIVIPILSIAQSPADDIAAAERLWADTWTNGDKAGYRELLADEFTWTFVTGRVMDKNQAVAALSAFTIPETSKTIHVYADSAVVYGTASLDFQGRPIDERFVRVWVKNEGGRWQVVLFQATEIE